MSHCYSVDTCMPTLFASTTPSTTPTFIIKELMEVSLNVLYVSKYYKYINISGHNAGAQTVL